QGNAIAADGAGNAYVTGATSSTNFPTASPRQASSGGGTSDAFVAKLNPTGSALVYSSYMGGSGADAGNGVAVDGTGQVFLTGSTTSTNFPTLSALQTTRRGPQDAFVARLNASGALVYSTFL